MSANAVKVGKVAKIRREVTMHELVLTIADYRQANQSLLAALQEANRQRDMAKGENERLALGHRDMQAKIIELSKKLQVKVNPPSVKKI